MNLLTINSGDTAWMLISSALVMLMTLRGVPCLFYGTEQYLNNNTNGGQDPYNRPMMNQWDTDSHSFKLVRSLLTLRECNQALSFGSHRTAWINDDFYLYTRNFRDSAVMVMVNKADHDHVVDAENIQMPDGTYTCQLTGYPVTISNSSLQNYVVQGKTAIVISVEGEPVSGQVVAVFQVNGFATQPGQRLAITGSCHELGAWDHDRSFGMEYVNDNPWLATVPFDASTGSLVNYKFLVHQEGSDPIVENLITRKLVLPQQGQISVDCFWGQVS